MSTPYAERELGHYLRNALRSEASAQLLKPVADAAAVVLGTATLGGTSQDLERAIDTFPSSGTYAEPFERNARYAAAEFALDEAELDILLLALRVRRGRQLARFGSALQAIMGDPSRVIATLLGHDLDGVQQRLAPGSRLCGCGLIVFDDDDVYEDGFPAILAISRAAATAMFAVHAGRDEWRAALIGRPCEPGLPWDAFDHLGAAGALAARVLAAAAAGGEAGIHVLLAGPPGTGKTEFARALATRAGLALYAAGEEADAQGSEPSRSARGTALRLSLTLLRQRRDVAVLLDEAEDLLDSTRSFGARRDAFSKVFLNRTLEQAAVPVLWTCNEIGWMDPATLRRMTLVVQMPVPDAARRTAIWERVLDSETLAVPAGAAAALAARWPVSAGIAAGSARAARLVGGGLAELEVALAGVAEAVGVTATIEASSLTAFDPALTVCGDDLGTLCARLARPGAPRGWSLCLSGPPGTGKSAFAHYLADRIGLPLLQKRASDLLSMWVGGSEKAIAAAFAEARTKGALLLIDEAEALLFDRDAASRAFEVSQVDEMLTWMERHPLPFVCTTNMVERMDAAVPRRFTLKLRFDALDSAHADLAFRRILGTVSPGALPDGLTPGDFALVRRKAELLAEARPSVLAQWLGEELAAKMGGHSPIGFRMPAKASPAQEIALRDAA
jgi:transitional endoplasmic reticulum ATPase